MDRNLFLAILSVDACSRSYGQGVILHLGDLTTGQDEAGRQIGNATILNVDLPTGPVSANLYAIVGHDGRGRFLRWPDDDRLLRHRCQSGRSLWNR